jgi:ABC-type sugar transport system ATPase subunit
MGAIIYISHRLDEVVAIADRCTVLRDGRVCGVSRRGALSITDLISAMSGRPGERMSPPSPSSADVLLRAGADATHVVEARGGEIIGLAGLLGSGAEAMLNRLFGIGRPMVVEVRGKSRRVKRPGDAIASGIGLVPGERRLGLVPNQSVRDNILLPNLDLISRLGWLNRAAGDRIVAALVDLLDIRPPRPKLKARALSGGNQQKVILAKWLARDIAVLLLQDPTQGIDVSAKEHIHSLIRDFAARGRAALINSSDLGELARLCGAVLAVRGNAIVATLDSDTGMDEPRLRTAIGG